MLVIAVCIALSVGYMIEIFEITPPLKQMPLSLQLFVYGGGVFLAVWLLFRKRIATFAVFEHELTHILVAKVFFLKTLHFDVSPRKHVQGKVVVGVEGQGGISRAVSVFFSLAPYYLPTLMLLVFALYPVLRPRFLFFFAFLVGFTAMYHVVTTFLEFGFHQADIQQHGEYFSTAFVLLGNIMFIGMALMVVLYGFQHVPAFLLSGILNIVGG